MGTEAPPIPSGVDLTTAPFKQCGANDTIRYGGWYSKYLEKCNPGTYGRFMYIYNKGQGSTRLNLCDVTIDIESRYHPPVQYPCNLSKSTLEFGHGWVMTKYSGLGLSTPACLDRLAIRWWLCARLHHFQCECATMEILQSYTKPSTYAIRDWNSHGAML